MDEWMNGWSDEIGEKDYGTDGKRGRVKINGIDGWMILIWY